MSAVVEVPQEIILVFKIVFVMELDFMELTAIFPVLHLILLNVFKFSTQHPQSSVCVASHAKIYYTMV